MDSIFHESKSIFDTVKIANNMPRRYGKNGELLISYDQTDEARRRSSVAQVRSHQYAAALNILTSFRAH